MFAESLVETSAQELAHRSWTTLASFTLQAVTVCVLMLLPLFHPQQLPALLFGVEHLTVPAGHTAPPPEMATRHFSPAGRSDLNNGVPVTPPRIPATIARVDDATAPPVDIGLAGSYVPGATGTPVNGSVPWALGNTQQAAMPTPPPAPHPLRTSQMMEGNLIHRVQPAYPALARQARVQGAVVLSAVIGRDGLIQNLRVLTGHPMLSKAALEAVSQWRYRPYLLNGDPVEVETRVTVNFVLAGQ
jgi:protein TonB